MTHNQQIIEQVTIEANKLKQSATDDELKYLDINSLKPSDPLLCIYGQMTGNCYSERATELIMSCCERVFEARGGKCLPDWDQAVLNGKPYGFERTDWYRPYYSPIELFIDIDENKLNGNNAALVAFLRGETDTLNLSTDF